MTPEDLLAAANKRAEVFVDKKSPLRLYLRSAENVFKQACVYETEGDLESAYVMFLKYSNLVIREFPKHPDYNPGTEQLKSLRSNCVHALDYCETRRPALLAHYRLKLEATQLNAARLREETEAARRSALEKAAEAKRSEEARQARMREIQMMEAQRTYELQRQRETERLSEAADLDYLDLVDSRPAAVAAVAPVLPPRPVPVPVVPPPEVYHVESPALKPIPAQLVSPTPKFYSESGAVLRKLSIPSNIISIFLQISSANNRKNIETCGVLAGRLAQNCFSITHLIIPKQEGTSDTCAMVAEEEILAVQDNFDLLTLGWIHTHPTQQCFLSSVDLHTQFPYQLMMAEAVAIVVAPTQSPNFGIFRLTDPPGLDIIASCPARGFHQHPTQQPIYRSLGGPESHAQFDGSLNLEVIDLR